MKRLLQSILTLLVGVGLFTELKSQNFTEISRSVASDRQSSAYLGQQIAVDGNYAIFGAYSEGKDENGLNPIQQAGAAYFYKLDPASGAWVETQKVVGTDRIKTGLLGWDVAISGEYAFASTIYHQLDENGLNPLNRAGAVFAYKRDAAGVWNQTQKIVASTRTSSDEFGSSVAASGGYLFIGSRGDDPLAPSSGSVRVYQVDASGMWNEVQELTPSDGATNDNFGNAIAVDGDYLAVGSPQNNFDALVTNNIDDAGAIFIFKKDAAGVWNEVQKIVAGDRGVDDNFGDMISISGDVLVTGLYLEDEDEFGMNTLSRSGSAYVFEKNGAGTWNQVKKLVNPDRRAGEYYGLSVTVLGDKIVVGCPSEDLDAQGLNPLSSAGGAFLYERTGLGNWNLIQRITADDRTISRFSAFGASTAMIDNFIFMGAPQHRYDALGNNSAPGAGGVYVFSTINTFIRHAECSATSYTAPSGAVYTMSGTYLDTVQDHLGGDSVLFITLTFGTPSSSSITVTNCGDYIAPSGAVFTTSGTYLDTIPNASSCDSVITISLTVYPTLMSSITSTFCYEDNIVVNGTHLRWK